MDIRKVIETTRQIVESDVRWLFSCKTDIVLYNKLFDEFLEIAIDQRVAQQKTKEAEKLAKGEKQ